MALPSFPVFTLAGVTETIVFPDASTFAVTFSPFTSQLPSPVTVMVTDDCFNFLMVMAFSEAVISVAVHTDGVGCGAGDEAGVVVGVGVGVGAVVAIEPDRRIVPVSPTATKVELP